MPGIRESSLEGQESLVKVSHINIMQTLFFFLVKCHLLKCNGEREECCITSRLRCYHNLDHQVFTSLNLSTLQRAHTNLFLFFCRDLSDTRGCQLQTLVSRSCRMWNSIFQFSCSIKILCKENEKLSYSLFLRCHVFLGVREIFIFSQFLSIFIFCSVSFNCFNLYFF